MKLLKNRLIPILGVMVIILSGCVSETSQFSPMQIIDKSLQEADDHNITYYGEVILEIVDLNDMPHTLYAKEWRKNGNVRIEIESEDQQDKSITILKEETLMYYDVNQNQLMLFEDPELLEASQFSFKEQAEYVLDLVRETHDVSIEGEETIVGRDAYHIVAKEKDQQSLLGDQEIWIDKETWLVLKMISILGDSQSESYYTFLDFNAKIPDDVFELDLPDDVDVVEMDDLLDLNEISMEGAIKLLEKPFWYFKETADVKIDRITAYNATNQFNRVEVSLDYVKNDLPYVILNIVESIEDADVLDSSMVEKQFEIRGEEATYMEMGDFRSLVWQEDGLNYSVVILDPNVKIEELQKMAEEMVLAEH